MDQPTPQSPTELARTFPPGRRPTRLTMIPPCGSGGGGELRAYANRFDLALALAAQLAGRELVLVRGQGTYPGFDTFPIFSVHALGQPGATGVRAAVYLCAVAVQDLTAEALDAAVTEAQQRLRQGAAA